MKKGIIVIVLVAALAAFFIMSKDRSEGTKSNIVIFGSSLNIFFITVKGAFYDEYLGIG